MTDTSLPAAMAERNREIIARRLGWPDGALEACRTLEARHDGWYCWWTPTPWPPPEFAGPAYGAARTCHRPGTRCLYAPAPDELAALIEAAGKEARW